MTWTPPKGWEMPQLLIELADDWHPSPYRIKVGWQGDLPEEIGTVAYDLSDDKRPKSKVTGRYLRTGTAADGVPVYAWIPNE